MEHWEMYDWDKYKGYIGYSGFLPSTYYKVGKELYSLEIIDKNSDVGLPINMIIYALYVP